MSTDTDSRLPIVQERLRTGRAVLQEVLRRKLGVIRRIRFASFVESLEIQEYGPDQILPSCETKRRTFLLGALWHIPMCPSLKVAATEEEEEEVGGGWGQWLKGQAPPPATKWEKTNKIQSGLFFLSSGVMFD